MGTPQKRTSRVGTRERKEVDVFSDMMAGAFTQTDESEATSFVDTFTAYAAPAAPVVQPSQVEPSEPASLGEQLAQRYGFKPSKEQTFDIPVERVLDSPYQEREERSRWTERQKHEYERLRAAIREGLNEVFFVAPHPEKPDYFFLAYGGHNRRDAAREEGHTTIPCVVIPYDDTNAQDQERVGFGTAFENEIKIPMTLVERGRLYRRLMEKHNLSQEKLARRLDLTRDVIKNCLMVAESADDVRELVRHLDEGGGVRLARSLNRLNDLAAIYSDQDAPRLARAPLIAAYRAGTMKTELIEAYIGEILRLAQLQQPASIVTILETVFHPVSAAASPGSYVNATPDAKIHEAPLAFPEVSGENLALVYQQPVITPSAAVLATAVKQELVTQPTQATDELASEKHVGSEDHSIRVDGSRSPFVSSIHGNQLAEQSQRFDKLLKAQRYFAAYCKLAKESERGEQEKRVLAELDEAIHEVLKVMDKQD